MFEWAIQTSPVSRPVETSRNAPATISLTKCQSPAISSATAMSSSADNGNIPVRKSCMKAPPKAPASTMCPEGKLPFVDPVRRLNACRVPCNKAVEFDSPKKIFRVLPLIAYAQMADGTGGNQRRTFLRWLRVGLICNPCRLIKEDIE